MTSTDDTRTSPRPGDPAAVLERLIVARLELEARREAMLDQQLAHDALVRQLASLALPGAVRQIYHDAYVPGRDYVSMLIEIYPNGSVQVSEVERGHNVHWPAAAPDGAHAATDAFPTGDEGEMPELSDELVKAALKPEEGDGLWEHYRNFITAGPGREVR